jgi:hypothetical protein
MSHHTVTLQSTSATAFAYALADRFYWLDDHYVLCRPSTHGLHLAFVTWLSVASTGDFVTLINVLLWRIDTTLQFMARDAQATTLDTFYDLFPKLPALAPLLCHWY